MANQPRHHRPIIVIYDPRRAAQELRERIIESMTAEELEQYAKDLEAQADALGRHCPDNGMEISPPET